MYLSACLDKGFSGRGFISPPALGWVERNSNPYSQIPVFGFISPPALGWVESRGFLFVYNLSNSLRFISPPALGWVESPEGACSCEYAR